MKFMLDTNICIYAIKKKPAGVFRKLQDNLSKGLCISSITLAELAYGVAKAVM
jgi:tRNA(fMet)-specific endonuclease VapC